MRDLDLSYLAVLVSRDGDRDLAGFYNIDRAKLYNELRHLAHGSSKRKYGPLTRVPIMQTMDVFGTQHSLDYIPLSPQGIESICLRCPKCNNKASKWLKKPAPDDEERKEKS